EHSRTLAHATTLGIEEAVTGRCGRSTTEHHRVRSTSVRLAGRLGAPRSCGGAPAPSRSGRAGGDREPMEQLERTVHLLPAANARTCTIWEPAPRRTGRPSGTSSCV